MTAISELIEVLDSIRHTKGDLPCFTYTASGLKPAEPDVGPLIDLNGRVMMPGFWTAWDAERFQGVLL